METPQRQSRGLCTLQPESLGAQGSNEPAGWAQRSTHTQHWSVGFVRTMVNQYHCAHQTFKGPHSPCSNPLSVSQELGQQRRKGVFIPKSPQSPTVPIAERTLCGVSPRGGGSRQLLGGEYERGVTVSRGPRKRLGKDQRAPCSLPLLLPLTSPTLCFIFTHL